MKKLLLIAFVILGIASAQAQEVNKWNIKEITDDFGDPTGDRFISYFSTEAEFSNSATTASKLIVGLRAESDKTDKTMLLVLAEYGSSLVTAYSDTRYIVKIKDDNGELHQTTLTMRQGSEYILGDGTIYDLLKVNQKLKFYMKEVTEGYPATYRFEVNTDNFNELLDSIQ